MKLLPKSITTYRKLKFSYIILVILVALLVGSVSYTYFSSAFNKEIEQTNLVLLGHYQNIINNVLERTERLSLTLSVKQLQSNDLHYFFDHPIEGNYSKILNINRQLSETVAANFQTIDSVSIYYDPVKMLISSSTGVSFLSERANNVDIMEEWIEQLNARNHKNLWISEKNNIQTLTSDYYGKPVYSFVRAYPNTSNRAEVKGFIVVNIKAEVLNSIVSQFKNYDYGILFVVDELGDVILSSNPSDEYNEVLNELKYEISEAESVEPINENRDVEGKRVMASHVTLYNDWKVVYITSTDEFYSKTILIQRTIIVICLFAIIIGLIISVLFTRNIYNPLGDLIKRIFDSKSDDTPDEKNEYNIINNFIDNLSVKMETIEQVIENNRPLINHNMVTNLILGRITNEEEFNTFLELNGISMPHGNYRIMLLQFSDRQLRNIPMRDRQQIKYLVMNYIDSLSDSETVFVTSFYTEDEATVIVNTSHDLGKMKQVAETIIFHLENTIKLETRASIGEPVSVPTDLKLSYVDVKKISKYTFFLCDRKVFTEEVIVYANEEKSEMPAGLHEGFARALRERKMDEIKISISQFIDLARSGEYEYDVCWNQLVQFVSEVQHYIKQTDLNTYDLLEDIYEILTSMYDVIDFENWILSTVEKVFQTMDDLEEDKNTIIVKKAKDFVNDNLEKGFSLREVAEHVGWSSSHFSRIFKQVTEENFMDFVTKERIDRAKDILLYDLDANIEEIAFKVGYSSSAYFINKFKLECGMTPNTFRMIHNKD